MQYKEKVTINNVFAFFAIFNSLNSEECVVEEIQNEEKNNQFRGWQRILDVKKTRKKQHLLPPLICY